jgi:hypothetical protein
MKPFLTVIIMKKTTMQRNHIFQIYSIADPDTDPQAVLAESARSRKEPKLLAGTGAGAVIKFRLRSGSWLRLQLRNWSPITHTLIFYFCIHHESLLRIKLSIAKSIK